MKRFIIILTVLLLVFTAAYYAASRQKAGGVVVFPTPTPYQLETVNSWNGILPGKSTTLDIESALGRPDSIIDKGAYKTYLFPTTNQYWKNEVSVSGQTATFIRERLFPPEQQSFVVLSKSISDSPTKLFGPDHESGFFLFTYPGRGVAYFVHAPMDTTYEVWRFPPSGLAALLSTKEFSRYSVRPVRNVE